MHAQLADGIGLNGRLLFVGDVHGCASELKALLSAVGFSPSEDDLVLVGDLVNKGPASGDVVKLARELGAWCVRGNHEDELLEAWFRVGRFAEGLDNYKHDALFQVSAGDVHWLLDLPLSLRLPRLPAIVVHAGLVPNIPLEEQKFRDLLFMRDLHLQDDKWVGLVKPAADGGSKPWASIWPGPEQIIFGHDANRKLQLCPFATGLDTGCCYGGSLTGLVVPQHNWEARSVVKVDADRMYEIPAHLRNASRDAQTKPRICPSEPEGQDCH